LANRRLRQRITITLNEDKGKVREAMKNDSLKREVTFLYVKRRMREEMERVWKDFFEKNPGEKEEVARRWLEGRLRSMPDPKDQGKGVPISVQNASRKKLRSEFR
jgi:hypothetical protein